MNQRQGRTEVLGRSRKAGPETTGSENGASDRGPGAPAREPNRSSSVRPDPIDVYQARLADRAARAERLERFHQRLADARLLVFVIGLGLGGLMLATGAPSPWWLLVPLAIFAGLVVASDLVRRRQDGARARAAFYQTGLDRVEDRWPGRGDAGHRFLQPDHPYDADLDLFGSGSLYERIVTARTEIGCRTLADWLRNPAEAAEARRRQQAVDDLRNRLDLREDLALIGGEIGRGLDPAALRAWGAAPAVGQARGLLVASLAFVPLNLGALVGWAAFDLGLSPLAVTCSATALLHLAARRRFRAANAEVERRFDELQRVGRLLERIEQEAFASDAVQALQLRLETEGTPPSKVISRLTLYIHLLEFRRNQFFVPFAFLMCWSVLLGWAIERWRGRFGPKVGDWLEAVGRFEALGSLAAYAFECPDDPFPILEESEAPVFDARALGHPLIPKSECVRNDLQIGGSRAPRALLVSGSNMSGKSTLLRSVGTNAVLAFAGAPARASSLRISELSIGATLRIQDSLQAGRSRFYAEITRLRQLVDLASTPPTLLFLLDEILHGTNSHDRRLGAEGVVRGLLDRGAIGLVTTHDLALAEIVETLGDRGANVHFEDHLEDGRIRFDYLMKPGIVRKSNALDLMRAVGLEV